MAAYLAVHVLKRCAAAIHMKFVSVPFALATVVTEKPRVLNVGVCPAEPLWLRRNGISLHVFFGAGNSNGIALFDGFGRQFLADTGLVRHGVAAIDGLVVVQAGFAAFGVESALVVFVDDEVGNDRFNLKGRSL